MEKKMFLMYEVPQVEIVEVEVEKGYTLSGSDEDMTPGMGNA